MDEGEHWRTARRMCRSIAAAFILLSREKGVSGLVPLCERAVDIVRQTAGIVASPSDLTYDIWTDGACAHKTSGAGGYAAVLVARRSDGSG